MSIFDSYRIIPKTYTPDNRESISYVTPSAPKKPLVSYNTLGEPIGLTWREGDPIWLEFSSAFSKINKGPCILLQSPFSLI